MSNLPKNFQVVISPPKLDWEITVYLGRWITGSGFLVSEMKCNDTYIHPYVAEGADQWDELRSQAGISMHNGLPILWPGVWNERGRAIAALAKRGIVNDWRKGIQMSLLLPAVREGQPYLLKTGETCTLGVGGSPYCITDIPTMQEAASLLPELMQGYETIVHIGADAAHEIASKGLTVTSVWDLASTNPLEGTDSFSLVSGDDEETLTYAIGTATSPNGFIVLHAAVDDQIDSASFNVEYTIVHHSTAMEVAKRFLKEAYEYVEDWESKHSPEATSGGNIDDLIVSVESDIEQFQTA